VHDADGLVVVAMAGELDLATVPRLRDRLVRVISEHPGEMVVLDLDGLSAVDDTGLGVLVGALRRARVHGGDVSLVCTSAELLEVFALTRLDRAFVIYPDVGAARRESVPSASGGRAEHAADHGDDADTAE
jgi:anti-sigma B factor antagonist